MGLTAVTTWALRGAGEAPPELDLRLKEAEAQLVPSCWSSWAVGGKHGREALSASERC